MCLEGVVVGGHRLGGLGPVAPDGREHRFRRRREGGRQCAIESTVARLCAGRGREQQQKQHRTGQTHHNSPPADCRASIAPCAITELRATDLEVVANATTNSTPSRPSGRAACVSTAVIRPWLYKTASVA